MRSQNLNQILFWLVSAILLLFTGCEEEFPPSEFEIGQIFLGSAYEIQVTSSHAYVSTNEGLAIIDIGDPAQPELTATFRTVEVVFGALVDGDLAFVGSASPEENLSIVDMSDRQNPLARASLPLTGAAYGIQRSGDLLYCATLGGGFHIVDISDLDAPRIISSLDCQGRCMDLAINGNMAYCANPDMGLQIIDISDPENPVIAETVGGTQGAWDIHLTGGYLFLGKHGNGFSIYRIEADHSFTYVVSDASGGEVYGIFKSGDLLYTGDLQEGVEIWDIGDVFHPLLLETIEEYAPHDITLSGDRIFLADQDRHFVILER